MCLLIETIKLQNGIFHNLDYHNERLNNSRKNIFKKSEPLDLYSYLREFDYPKKGLFKVRVEYAENFKNTSFVSYTPVTITSLKVVINNNISYYYKYADRKCFQNIITGKNEEAIIIKNGFVTDCTYANLAFSDGKSWFTPNTYLLNGTKRQLYIDRGEIIPVKMRVKDIFHFNKVSLINSMLDLKEVCISTENIRK